jgi:hypothetical protein
MMSIGATTAVVCLDAIDDADARAHVSDAIVGSGRRMVEITRAQMGCFAGNVLQLATRSGARIWAMSTRAYGALDPTQRRALQVEGPILHVAIPTIERNGGGSVRCMLGEIFRPNGN